MDDELFNLLLDAPAEPEQGAADPSLAERGAAGPQNIEEVYRAYVKPVVESGPAQWAGNAALGAVDGLTMSARLPIEALITGENLADVVARDDKRAEQNMFANTAGLIAGAVASGYGLYKGAAAGGGALTGIGSKAAQQAMEATAMRRMLIGATLGAAEGGMHTLMRTGDLEKTGESALWGAGIGAAFQGVLEMGSTVGKWALNAKSPQMRQKAAADEMLLDLQRRQIVKPDGSPIDEQELTRRLLHRAAGNESVGNLLDAGSLDVNLLGVVPELGDYAKQMGYSQSPEDQVAFARFYFNSLENAKAAQSRSVSQAVQRVHQMVPRDPSLPDGQLTLGGVKQLQNELRKATNPRYTTALKAADEMGVRADPGELYDVLSAPGVSIPKDKRGAFAKAVSGDVSADTKQIIEALFKPARKAKGVAPRKNLERDGAALLREVSMRDLYSMRSRVDDLIGKAKDGVGGWGKDALNGLYEVRNRINALSHSTQARHLFDDLAVLDTEFGGISAMSDGYAAGREFMKTGRWEGKPYQRFVENPGHTSNIAAVAMERGIADELVEKLGALRNPQQVINYMANEPARAARIKALVGEDGFSRIIASAVNLDAATLAHNAIGSPGPSVVHDGLVPAGIGKIARDAISGNGGAVPSAPQAAAGVSMLQSNPMSTSPTSTLGLIDAMQKAGTVPQAAAQLSATGAGAGLMATGSPDQPTPTDGLFDSLIEQ